MTGDRACSRLSWTAWFQVEILWSDPCQVDVVLNRSENCVVSHNSGKVVYILCTALPPNHILHQQDSKLQLHQKLLHLTGSRIKHCHNHISKSRPSPAGSWRWPGWHLCLTRFNPLWSDQLKLNSDCDSLAPIHHPARFHPLWSRADLILFRWGQS
jgi:hypothetical protein